MERAQLLAACDALDLWTHYLDEGSTLLDTLRAVLRRRVEGYLLKKGLAYLIDAIPGLPLLRATEWFADEAIFPRLEGIATSQRALAVLHPSPDPLQPISGLQVPGTHLHIIDYSLNLQDFSLWYRLDNHVEGLYPAEWIASQEVYLMNFRTLLDLPFAEFEVQ